MPSDDTTPAAPDAPSPQYAEAVELFETVFLWISPQLTDAEIERAFQAARAEWRHDQERRREFERRRQASPGTSLLSLLGGPPAPGATVSAPTGPIMADPARVFERKPATKAKTAGIAEVEAADIQDARQSAQDASGEPLSLRKQGG